jgi:general secretion pathway protein G
LFLSFCVILKDIKINKKVSNMQIVKSSKAFTMIELVFVIVIIGILSAIAIPKFAVTRGDAVVSKAKNTVASIRSSVATARQKLILKGTFEPITRLTSTSGYNQVIFDGINGDTTIPTLEYPLLSCKSSTERSECWYTGDNITYTFYMPGGTAVDFNLTGNRFVCKLPTSDGCKLLTR